MTVVKKDARETDVKDARPPAAKNVIGEGIIKVRADTSEFEQMLAGLAPKKSAAASAFSFHPKVAAGGVGWWLSVIVLYCIHHYAHQNLPVAVDGAVTGLVTFVCAWATPST